MTSSHVATRLGGTTRGPVAREPSDLRDEVSCDLGD